MYNPVKILTLFVFTALLFSTGCTNNSELLSSSPGQRNSKLIMNANAFHKIALYNDAVRINQNGNDKYIQFDLNGGSIDVQTAWINFIDLSIEENSGSDNEQDGENNDNNQDNDSENDDGNENEAQDITAPGPFSVDVSGGTTSIGNFDVYAGTFKKVDLGLTPELADPFTGNSIVINGNYSDEQGNIVPFTLKSAKSIQLQLPLANGGITISENSKATIEVIFDLPGWFNSVDLSTADITGSDILIDSQNNTSLLSAFEANISAYVDVEDGDD